MKPALITTLGGASGGSVTIELALILPIFSTMLIGVVDVTTAFNRKLELEQAVQRSIERVMQTTTDQTVEANIKAEAAQAAGIDESDVTVTYSQTCDGTDTPPDDDCATGETAMRYTNVSATTTFTPLFPVARFGITSGYFTLTAETGVRTS